MRAGSLQELVYKQGQAGVTKASVTVTFNNQDKKSSPVGYEHVDKISVCRQVCGALLTSCVLACLIEAHRAIVSIVRPCTQVVVGGKNKYLINGAAVQASQVQNLFHSVQLNVNNPHFLIMQGRITKVGPSARPSVLTLLPSSPPHISSSSSSVLRV